MKEQDLQQLFDWMTRQPEAVKQLMEKFPPRCTVKGNVTLMCPAPGKTAKVAAYHEGQKPDDLTVIVENEDGQCHECEPGWLTVVRYEEGITPELVRAVCNLGDEVEEVTGGPRGGRLFPEEK